MFIPSMMSLIMIVQLHPELTDKLGLIGTKANLLRFGDPNWTNYLNLMTQAFAGVGLVGTGFVASWCFGREFSEHMIKDILVVPMKRYWFVISKSIVLVVWSAILSIVYFTAAAAMGLLIGLPGLSAALLFHGFVVFAVTALLMLPLFTPVAFLASYSRGFMLPLAFVILTLILANFSGLLGVGPYFPWAIPGLYGMPASAEGMQLSLTSYIILFLTGAVGLEGTILLWRYADQK
jgi:ABC-2 type transport system permease protein